MFLLFIFAAIAAAQQSPSSAAATLSAETVVVSLSTSHQLFTCFDAKNRSDANSILRQSEFHCSEHNAEAIEHLLIPSIMCCDNKQCVPSFAEEQQSFLIDSMECNANKDRCRIILRCQPAFDALIGVACGTALSIIIVIISSFWMNSSGGNGRLKKPSAIISTRAFYEQTDKTN